MRELRHSRRSSLTTNSGVMHERKHHFHSKKDQHKAEEEHCKLIPDYPRRNGCHPGCNRRQDRSHILKYGRQGRCFSHRDSFHIIFLIFRKIRRTTPNTVRARANPTSISLAIQEDSVDIHWIKVLIISVICWRKAVIYHLLKIEYKNVQTLSRKNTIISTQRRNPKRSCCGSTPIILINSWYIVLSPYKINEREECDHNK